MSLSRPAVVALVLTLVNFIAGCTSETREISNDATAAPQVAEGASQDLKTLAREFAGQVIHIAGSRRLYSDPMFAETGGLISDSPVPRAWGAPQNTPSLQISRIFPVANGEAAADSEELGQFDISANGPSTMNELCEIRVAYVFNSASKGSVRQPLSPGLVGEALNTENEEVLKLNTLTILPSINRTYLAGDARQIFLSLDPSTNKFNEVVNGEFQPVPDAQLQEYLAIFAEIRSCVTSKFR